MSGHFSMLSSAITPDFSTRFRIEDPVAFPWFALKVRANGEALVDGFLRRKFYETFLPVYEECRAYSDRICRVESALFPGYLFCRFDPERRLPVLTTPGVHDVVRLGNSPTPVDESEIEALRKFIGSGFTAKPWPYLCAGDRVRVEFGSLKGLEGLLVKEKGAERLILSVSLLQRSVSVEIDRTWIRPVNPRVSSSRSV